MSLKTQNPLLRVARSLGLTLIDAGFAYVAMLCAVRWRYDFLNKPIIENIDHRAGLIAALATVVLWVIMRQERAIWRFTSLKDFRKLFLGVISVSALVPLALFLFFDRGEHFPRSAPFSSGGLFFAFILMSRLFTMIVQNGDFRALFRAPSLAAQDALLIGPAPYLYNHLRDSSRRKGGAGFNPVGLIETSGAYQGRSIRSVPVLGTPDDLRDIYPRLSARRDKPLQLISVDPNPDRESTARLLKVASDLGAPLGRQSSDTKMGLSAFEASDLIGREMRMLDITPVRRLFQGRRVLVTGAGGSIGSEISEQIAKLDPASLILVDSSEFHLYSLDKRLAPITSKTSDKSWHVRIGDVRDRSRMDEIFTTEKPEIVVHAAALKHVPLGEDNPLETLSTNVNGTSVILDMCEAHDVEHFILISTDKAVDPFNMMGASKRIVEMLTLARQSLNPDLQASAVRFGNVLASNGSVVNLFEDQIALGGPVTVTHREVNRYFMTVEEASALVLQTAALGAQRSNGHGDATGCIYVLDMGEPVNIARLARQLIRLRGKVPDVDIEVHYTGLRPGEKLTEVLAHAEEDLFPTAVSGVQRLNGDLVDPPSVLRRIETLINAVDARDRVGVAKALQRLIPDYDPGETLAAPAPAKPTRSNVVPLDVSASSTDIRDAAQ